MKQALEVWRHHLLGAIMPIVVLTDHKNLEYLQSSKTLNSNQTRWSDQESQPNVGVISHGIRKLQLG
jgi:hypothetical protein